jgi:hypothetical protein
MLQGCNESHLKSSFRKFYGRYNDLVCDYKLSLAHMVTSNSEDNNVSNVIIIQKADTKSIVGQHARPTNAKVGSGA